MTGVTNFESIRSQRIRYRRCAARRWVFDLAVLLPVAWLMALTWFALWYEIPTGSMAPTLLGAHCEVRCDDCRWRYEIGYDPPPQLDQRVVCPNCGYVGQQLQEAAELAGDRVLVSRAAFAFQVPRRWEVVACQSQHKRHAQFTKRIVGLPGEEVLLRDGDVYINGNLARKSLAEQQSLAILVHDAGYEPGATSHAPACWRGEAETRWERLSGRWTCLPRDRSEEHVTPPDWLVYHHPRRDRTDVDRVEDTPVTDRYGYNQTQPVRDLHALRDLMVTARVRCWRDGRWLVRATDGTNEFVAAFQQAAERFDVYHSGRHLASRPVKLTADAEHRLCVSFVDHRYQLELDGQLLYEQDLEITESQTPPSAQPFALGTQGAGLDLRELRIWRDIYYTLPPELQRSPDLEQPPAATYAQGLLVPYVLGPEEYFVLGDNSPLSIDSRYVSFGPAVPASMLIGKPCFIWRRR